MALSPQEQLTLSFYDWEKRGRGRYIFNIPIDLEPEFVPFIRQPIHAYDRDDAKRPSLLGGMLNYVSDTLSLESKKEPPEKQSESPVNAYPFACDEKCCAITVSFPKDVILTGLENEQLLIMLSSTRFPVSFEIIASSSFIRFQFVCRSSDSEYIISQLKGYFPDCIIQEKPEEYLEVVTDEAGCFVDFGLKEEFTRPIAMAERTKLDPLQGFLGILEYLKQNETVVFQVLFKGTVNEWAKSILTSVSDDAGGSFFIDAPEMPKLAEAKVSAPLFAASVRLLCQASQIEQAYSLLERIGNAVVRISQSSSNELIPLTASNYPIEHQLQDIYYRTSRRAGTILNAKELASLIRFPLTSNKLNKLERDVRKTKQAPRIAEGHDFILGRNIHQGYECLPTLDTTQRLKHMHVIGATGTGKSTFLQSCIFQDIMLGNGIAVLDPHGDLIESILPYIPESRYDNVVIVDPSDAEFPVGFNILTAHSDIEKEILASDLVSVFRRLSTSFGDQMHSVLANAILAFLESNTGGTLIELRRFLIEKPYRDEFLKTVSDPSIVYYWQKEYPLLKTSSIGPILTRLDSFLRPKVIRNMVAQKRSLDFADILDSQKILFVKLSQGLIGAENSYLLGTFFVSKIYQAAMARQTQAKGERKPFYLYIDEFQNFITPSMSSILSGTRKYGLGCILAHQDMIQVQKADPELASAVISNAGTRVCFRLGDIDAKRFEDGFASFDASDLQNLGLGQAIIRIERPENDCNISALQLNEPDLSKGAVETVITLSRQIYGTSREEVEKSLEYLRVTAAHDEKIEAKQEQVNEDQKVKEQYKVETDKQPNKSLKADEAQKAKTKEKLVKQNEISQHRYLQTLIKKMAEARGFKATIEHPTPDGHGRVDVLLEKDGKQLACEVGVTTTKEWEIHNLQKCLKAGFETVVAIALDFKTQGYMERIIAEQLQPDLSKRVMVMEATAFFQYLDSLNITPEEATTIKGYRVKVNYGSGNYQHNREHLLDVLLKGSSKD